MKASALSISAAAAVAAIATASPLVSSASAFTSPPLVSGARTASASLPKPSSSARRIASSSSGIQEDLTFIPPDTSGDGEISEQLCADAASRMKRVMVPVSKDVSDSGYVGISFIHWPAASAKKKVTLPLLLVHGFDSSALEYRRLGPRLAELGVDVYCVDLLGWGYTQLDSVKDFSAKAKVEALSGFWRTVGGDREVVVGGASLGGAAVIEFAAQNLCVEDEADRTGIVRGTVLIDAQGFVDGIGPMSFLPAPLARAGIKVLQSVPLRSSANQMSYFNKDAYATEDALKVGRLHCLREGWEDGMLSFMQSGGFRPKEKVPTINVPSLVLWGRQDGILEGNEFANKFIDAMPNARLQWIEECGHVPHLEQPEMTAQYISDFLRSEEVRPSKSKTAASTGILDALLKFVNQ